jgi:ATP-binding cassette subfamily B multidrug efflux pump
MDIKGGIKELATLNKYFVKHKWRLLAGIFFVICANALQNFNPMQTREAVNLLSDYLKNVKPGTGIDHVVRSDVSWQVFKIFVMYFAVALLSGAFTFLMRQSIIVVSRLIEFDMKNDIYAHYQKIDLAFYRRNSTGDLMNRITEDVARVRMYVGPAIMYAVNLFFSITFAIVAMLSINKTVALYVLIPLPILSLLIHYINNKIDKASGKVQEKLSDLTVDAQETYSGIRVVQNYNREEEMINHFKEETEEYKQRQLKLALVDSLWFPIMGFLVGCSTVLVLLFGGFEFAGQRLSQGDLVAFFQYVNLLMWPVSSLGWVAGMVQRAITSQRRINQFLAHKPAVETGKGQDVKLQGEIVFDNVDFVYPDTGIHAIKNVNFKIKAGERWAVIGRTGSGKSTIAELLMRMYDTTGGSILIDGHNIKDLELGSLRRQIGFVPQDVFLFSEDIYNNIAFGLPETDKEEAKQYAHHASIGAEIERFPQGYDTIVGERGVTLSGGQKQRISIARALIKKPNILLLDDSLSAVDSATEKQIQKSLDNLLAGKTAIVITHRIFALMHFDHILVLDNGKITEQGSHEELMRRNGMYADIYNRQLQEETVK